MNKIIEGLINRAKEIAKEDYEAPLRKVGALNPKYKRNWRKQKGKDGSYTFAYEGTPDKAFVIVYPKLRQVVAVRRDKTIIKQSTY